MLRDILFSSTKCAHKWSGSFCYCMYFSSSVYVFPFERKVGNSKKVVVLPLLASSMPLSSPPLVSKSSPGVKISERKMLSEIFMYYISGWYFWNCFIFYFWSHVIRMTAFMCRNRRGMKCLLKANLQLRDGMWVYSKHTDSYTHTHSRTHTLHRHTSHKEAQVCVNSDTPQAHHFKRCWRAIICYVYRTVITIMKV